MKRDCCTYNSPFLTVYYFYNIKLTHLRKNGIIGLQHHSYIFRTDIVFHLLRADNRLEKPPAACKVIAVIAVSR